MENSNKQSGLKDISNISRNLVSAFPQVNSAIQDEQDKENVNPPQGSKKAIIRGKWTNKKMKS